MIKKRAEERKQWLDQPQELRWRESLKTYDVIDIKTWNGVWTIGQVLSVGRDPNMLLVAPNKEHMRRIEWFTR